MYAPVEKLQLMMENPTFYPSFIRFKFELNSTAKIQRETWFQDLAAQSQTVLDTCKTQLRTLMIKMQEKELVCANNSFCDQFFVLLHEDFCV